MPRERHAEPGTDEQAQAALIPMSDEELRDAARQLAGKVKALEDMKRDHAEIRREQRQEREALEREIEEMARIIRTQGR